ncbi:hypothetical protein FACS1894187_11250 [Synergistales bacterium]|nr:hypothetical protein FACS1894187_11250 [Synergistales bacterium]
MLYLSGIYALNLNCALDTCGDWHQSSLRWDNLFLQESKSAFFADYGIEQNKNIPCHNELFNVANHIRALLDLIIQGNFGLAQGMNNDFICNDNYTMEIFNKILLMQKLPHWGDIDIFMGREYHGEWLDFKIARNI